MNTIATATPLSPFSTGQFARSCKTCGAPFVGLGTLCPSHLAAHAKTRAQEIRAAQSHSRQIISAREQQARHPRTELPDELDG